MQFPTPTSRRCRCRLVGLVLLTALPLPARVAAGALERVIVLNEVVQDIGAPTGRRDGFYDATLIAVSGRAWGALNVGNFARGLEVGGSVHDARGSTWTGTAIRRQGGMLQYTSLQVETSQRLVGSGVAMAALRALWPDQPEDDNLLFVPTLGFDQYLAGGWSFVAFRATFDPRPDTGVVFRILGRLANATSHVQVDIAPRTDGVVNFGVRARWHLLLAGYSYESDFDFTRFDRGVLSFGLQYDFAVP
jgi:hypothetical protein